MSNFFRFLENYQTAQSPSRQRFPLRRALLIGLGLVLLWAVLQQLPDADERAGAALRSENAISLRSEPSRAQPERSLSLFSLRNAIALMLLAGGGALAVYLRKTSGRTASPSTALQQIETLSFSNGSELRLVACYGERLLLGVTNGRITLIRRYGADDDGEATPAPKAVADGWARFALQEPAAAAMPDTPPVPDFSSLLRHFSASNSQPH